MAVPLIDCIKEGQARIGFTNKTFPEALQFAMGLTYDSATYLTSREREARDEFLENVKKLSSRPGLQKIIGEAVQASSSIGDLGQLLKIRDVHEQQQYLYRVQMRPEAIEDAIARFDELCGFRKAIWRGETFQTTPEA